MANTQYKFKKSTFSYSGTSEVVAGSDKIENGDIVIALNDKNSPETARMYVKNPFGAAYDTDGDLFPIGTNVDSLTTTKGVKVGTHLRVEGTSKFDGEIDTDSTIELTDQQANKSNTITSNSISFTGQSNDNAATISSDKSLTFNANDYSIVMGSSGIRLSNSSESILFEGDTSNAAAKLTAGNGLWVGTGYASIEMPDSDPYVNINGDTNISGTLDVSSGMSAASGSISSILTNSVTQSEEDLDHNTYKLYFGKGSTQSDYPEISLSFKHSGSSAEEKLITMNYYEDDTDPEYPIMYGAIGCNGTITSTGGAGFSTNKGYSIWKSIPNVGTERTFFVDDDGEIFIRRAQGTQWVRSYSFTKNENDVFVCNTAIPYGFYIVTVQRGGFTVQSPVLYSGALTVYFPVVRFSQGATDVFELRVSSTKTYISVENSDGVVPLSVGLHSIGINYT